MQQFAAEAGQLSRRELFDASRHDLFSFCRLLVVPYLITSTCKLVEKIWLPVPVLISSVHLRLKMRNAPAPYVMLWEEAHQAPARATTLGD